MAPTGFKKCREHSAIVGELGVRFGMSAFPHRLAPDCPVVPSQDRDLATCTEMRILLQALAHNTRDHSQLAPALFHSKCPLGAGHCVPLQRSRVCADCMAPCV